MSAVFYNDNRAAHEIRSRLLKDGLKSLNDALGSGIDETKENHTNDLTGALRESLSEIEIKREYDAVLLDGKLKDIAIGQALELPVAKMHAIVALLAKPFDDPHGNAHIGQKLHGFLRRVGLSPGSTMPHTA